jgi:ubiquinone/menaquinone biosynthesis C-methylase UbiE
MTGFIATWYARNTKDEGRHGATAASLLARLPEGARVLEVAPGPGYLATAIAKRRDLHVTGLDISESFVRIAREHAASEGVEVDFRQGNASAMPFEDGAFDFVTCHAAFKNFSDPVGALDEIHRVLAPGGRATVVDLRKDASFEDIEEEIAKMKLSAMSAFWTRLTFRTFLLKNAYTEEAMIALVEKSRFGTCELLRDGIGFEVRLER